jgi:hypothetical protein
MQYDAAKLKVILNCHQEISNYGTFTLPDPVPIDSNWF